jgi:hypothetical protein
MNDTDHEPFAPYWCEICQADIPSSALTHRDLDGSHSVQPIRPASVPYSPTTRKYNYRWYDPTQDVFSRPVISVTAIYDPQTHNPDMIRWQLEKALQQLITSIVRDEQQAEQTEQAE